MNKLEFLIIHCSATPEGRDMKAQEIKDFHMRPKSKGGRGWSKPGYSVVFELSGNLVKLVPYNDNEFVEQNEVTFGAQGLNHKARHICYVGGMDKKNKYAKDTRTVEQETAMRKYVLDFHKKYPTVKIYGHYRFAPKECPSFNVEKWLKEIGIEQ